MRSGDVSSNLPLSSSQLLVYLPQASDIFSDFFLAIMVPRPIWGMPAKNWGLGPLVLEEIDPAQTVVNPKLKFIYR
jgi:hypothetical protein